MHVGILDPIVLQDQSRLKQAALAFDRLVIVGGALLPVVRDLVPERLSEQGQILAQTYDFLLAEQIVEPMAGGAVDSLFEGLDERSVIGAALLSEDLRPIRERMLDQFTNASDDERVALVATATNASLRRAAIYYQTTKALDAVAVVPDPPAASQVLATGHDAVADVLLQNMPFPDDTTPWEAILDFRRDPEIRRKYDLLRTWLNELTREDLSPIELQDEFRATLSDYEHRMRVARLKVRRGPMRAVLTIAAEALEGLVRLKPTKIVDAFFVVRDGRIALLEAELGAPGREIAYVLDARERFG